MALVDRSIEQIEGHSWGEPEEAPTSMIARCLRLRRVPLGQLTQGDVRLLIGQGIGVEILLPIAMGWLREDPAIYVDYYPGDLLWFVLNAPSLAWEKYPKLRMEAAELLRRFKAGAGYAELSEELRIQFDAVAEKFAKQVHP
jgi:hypothetical protein